MKRTENGIVMRFWLDGNKIAAVISEKTVTKDH